MHRPIFDLFTLNIILTATAAEMHVCIASNRLWALCYPVHYRRKHNMKTALVIVFSAILYGHLVIVPWITVDGVLYRALDDCFSTMNELWSYYAFVAIGFYTVLYVAPIFIYPFVLYKFKQHQSPFHKPAGTKPIAIY